jgi:hypothetical protein
MQSLFRPSDFLWAFAAPVYYLLYAVRHEGSHALAAILVGARIREFHINLFGAIDGTRSAGHVLVERTKWDTFVLAAPYIGDLAVALLCAGFSAQISRRISNRHLWLNLVFLTAGLSFLDSLTNFCGYLFFHRGDLNLISSTVSPFYIYMYFCITIISYVLVTMYLVLKLESVSTSRMTSGVGNS